MRHPDGGAGLYVHVPFCSSICPYCDFAVTLAGEARREQWERLILLEARQASEYRGAFDTLYFGGGTPSLLAAARIGRLLDGLSSSLELTADCRFHFEANPENIDEHMLKVWRDFGFSVLSIGVQSFDDGVLGALGRRHDGKQAGEAVRRALEAGFETVSVDLIFGMEGQDEECWRRDLETAVELRVQHVSCYQLTIEKDSLFGRKKKKGLLHEMDEDHQAELYLLAHKVLSDHGLEVYEISNFARSGYESKHNLKYWRGDPYLGLGPAAHSFDGHRLRWWKERKLRRWAAKLEAGEDAVESREFLSSGQRLLEEILLGLRLAEGLDLAMLEEKYSRPLIKPNATLISGFLEEGLVRVDGTRIRLSPRGMAVADGIVRAFELGEDERLDSLSPLPG